MAEGDGGSRQGDPHAPGTPTEAPLPAPWWLSIDRDPEPSAPVHLCRFLASETVEGVLGPPIPTVDGANRCLALGDAAPQSDRQQELVCLTVAHATCPRYLRGARLESSGPAAQRRQPVSVAVIAASLTLVAAIAASFGFLAVRGGLSVELLIPSPGASQVAVVPVASLAPGRTPAASPGVTSSPSPAATPSGSPSPSPSPTPSEPPTPRPTATPRPSSDRYAVLEPCPSTPSCWIYTVRSGDNLVSIAHWFGVPLETVYEMNPWARTTGLRAGQELRLPPPTR